MTEMSAAEAAIVARFEAGEPAPESWDGGLRSALAEVVHDLIECSDDWGTPTCEKFADAVLALPEVAALRAKADAVDRVRELAAMWDQTADRYLALSRDAEMPREHRQRAWDQYQTLSEVASDVRRALDGDRGRC